MSTRHTPAPVVRSADEGERRWFHGGGVHTWKVHAEESGGAFLLFEDAMDQGKMTPLHTHPESDETMIVLEGTILMHLDGREQRVDAGGVALAPRGLPHAFLVDLRADAPALPAHARLLRVLLPARQRPARVGRGGRRRRRLRPGPRRRRDVRRDRDPRAASLRPARKRDPGRLRGTPTGYPRA